MTRRLEYLGLLSMLLLSGPGPTVGGSAFAARPSLAKGREHWAFRPVCTPAMPAVHDRTWARSPLDVFVLARLEAAGFHPAPPADRRTLLRRVYLDLIGLPPTPAEQSAFLADTAPDAYPRVVDRLLARPEYGERWARHWLDVARYAETNGYERDGAKPSAWRYRDYVIDAFNRDLPYDRFITEQLAGDEMPDTSSRTQVATTFLRLGTWDDEPANSLVDRYDQLDDVLGTTASAFLGVTLRCARCHDHKFEPFTQVDYYRMLAVFEPLKRPQRGRADLDRPTGSQEEKESYKKAQARIDSEIAGRRRQIDEQKLAIRKRAIDGDKGLTEEARAAFRVDPSRRTPAQSQLVKKFDLDLHVAIRRATRPEDQRQLQELERQITALIKARPADLPRAYVWYEEGPRAPVSHLFKRGDPTRATVAVKPGLPEVLVRSQPPAPSALAQSSGRRLWLARWIASPTNPLTARVMVNRVWQHHFGRGLVSTANDFGVMGAAPSHPALLDWLAARFMAEGWRLKPLHRLIVTSSIYQTSSALGLGETRGDRRLDLFGRWRQHRLEAEAVRDTVLAVSGQLNPRRGGPSIYPTLPRAVLEGQSRPGEGWGRSDARQAARRSIYVYSKRALVPPELDLLDAPDTTSSCEQRLVSTTAPQALTFLNGAFLQEQARLFAARLVREVGTDPAVQVPRAFELALCRPPSAEEQRQAMAFLARHQRQIEADARKEGKSPADARHRALAGFCLVLLNTNEFVYPG